MTPFRRSGTGQVTRGTVRHVRSDSRVMPMLAAMMVGLAIGGLVGSGLVAATVACVTLAIFIAWTNRPER